MPDHIHIFFELGETHDLGNVVASFGKHTTRQINLLNGWTGPFWQRHYYDRRIRSEGEFRNQVEYVRQNPVKRGLVRKAERWPYLWVSEGWGPS